MQVKDIYWLAGLLEGEGYFGHKGSTLAVILAMTDKDTVEKAAILMLGVCKEEPTKINRKQIYRVEINGSRAAQIMMTVFTLMNSRRQGRIRQSLERWLKQPVSNRVRTCCSKGHAYTEENLYYYDEKRCCRECRKQASRNFRLSQTTNSDSCYGVINRFKSNAGTSLSSEIGLEESAALLSGGVA